MVLNKSWLKTIFLLLLIYFTSCSNTKNEISDFRKTKILVFGTYHTIPDSSKEKVDFILKKLKGFKPDLIATEHPPHYGKASFEHSRTGYYKKAKN